VLADERYDTARELVLFSELESLEHVIPDDRGARRRLELVVRISSLRLILGEILRLFQLTDVVVERANAREQTVRADSVGRAFREIGDRDRVRVRPRGLEAQPTKQRPIEIRPLEQRE